MTARELLTDDCPHVRGDRLVKANCVDCLAAALEDLRRSTIEECARVAQLFGNACATAIRRLLGEAPDTERTPQP